MKYKISTDKAIIKLMTADQQTIRRVIEERMPGQTEHPVWPELEVLWGEPFDAFQLQVRQGPLIERISPEELNRRIRKREKLIERSRTDKLRWLCEPEEYRRIDLECARKRLEMPGVQLALWVSGGIRSSKTEFVTRRVCANFCYTENAWCWGFHETDTTSRGIQQARVYEFLPRELKPESGKMRKDLKTKFNYSEGNGFTGSEFNLRWQCRDEEGREFTGGGKFEFRFYGQDPGTMVGQELTCSTCDELVPPKVVKLIDDRLQTRAGDTRDPRFLARIEKAVQLLEAGKPLPLPLLGAIYHGWNLISFTPKEGWTPSCAMFLQGSREYDLYDPTPMAASAMEEAIAAQLTPERREAQRAKLEAKPWTLGGVKDLPRFAQPADERKLVAFLPTYANVFKGNWPGAVQSVQGQSREEIEVKLFGVVRRNITSLLGYNAERHCHPESALPPAGTIYEVADPAPKKPWVIKWYLVDAAGRKRVVQEWPCETWEIELHGFPGPWATASESDRINGDPGPAQRLQLERGWDDYTRRVWLGRKRLAERLRAVHGAKLEVATETRVLEWSEHPSWKLEGEFVKVAASWMDGRFASLPTVSKGGTNSTAIEEMIDAENGIEWDRADGGSVEDGVLMMQAAMSSEVLGIPELSAQDECTNTLFAWNTFSFPEHGDSTRKSDEACKDFIDPDRYLLLKDPEDTANVQLIS